MKLRFIRSSQPWKCYHVFWFDIVTKSSNSRNTLIKFCYDWIILFSFICTHHNWPGRIGLSSIFWSCLPWLRRRHPVCRSPVSCYDLTRCRLELIAYLTDTQTELVHASLSCRGAAAAVATRYYLCPYSPPSVIPEIPDMTLKKPTQR